MQGVNKYLKTRILITGASHAALLTPVPVRRLCDVEVVNIRQPVGLYELCSSDPTAWEALKGLYEAALAAFEGDQVRRAVKLLGEILDTHPDDGPSMRLLGRAVEAMSDPGPMRTVWVLPGK